MKTRRKLRLYLILLLVIPWFSAPLLGKKTLKRFFPSVLMLHSLIVGEQYLAKRRVWWWYFKKFNGKWSGESSLVWGPFLMSSLWVLKMTYGHFLRYFVVNTAVDSFYTYYIMDWFKRIGFASLIRLKKYQLSLLFVCKALILYGLQMLVERVFRSQKLKNL